MLQIWSDFFRKGKNGKLREPDPEKDPSWVKRPCEKGVLRVEYPLKNGDEFNGI